MKTKHLIEKNQSILDALSGLGQVEPEATLLVVDKDKSIIGIVTGGDIYRGLVEGRTLSDPVQRCMRRDFVSVRNGEPYSQGIEMAQDEGSRWGGRPASRHRPPGSPLKPKYSSPGSESQQRVPSARRHAPGHPGQPGRQRQHCERYRRSVAACARDASAPGLCGSRYPGSRRTFPISISCNPDHLPCTCIAFAVTPESPTSAATPPRSDAPCRSPLLCDCHRHAFHEASGIPLA